MWQIFVISVITEIVIHILPNEKYVAHIRLVSGVILAYTVILPIVSFITGDDYDKLFNSFNTNSMMTQLKNEVAFYADDSGNVYIKSYEEEYEALVEKMIIEMGFIPETVKVSLDSDVESKSFGQINTVSVKIPDAKDTDRLYIKKSLVGQLKIGSVKITVY